MQEIIVSRKEEGQQLLKLLGKYLAGAPQSFFYKMLRKKNITLNGGRADGKEKVAAGNHIRLYLSDDTIREFGGEALFAGEPAARGAGGDKSYLRPEPIDAARYGFTVLYEDEDILLVNKPAGLLVQKAAPGDMSLNEKIQEYLLDSGALTRGEQKTFHPGVCNRLDRNTSGIVTAGKTMAGLQFLSGAFRERGLKKYYKCIVFGEIWEPVFLEGYLKKDAARNKADILPAGMAREQGGYEKIQTAYRPLAVKNGFTLLEVDLVTGKPHQIRAHLASAGHCILGDAKYGTAPANGQARKRFGLDCQLLHAERLVFGTNPERFSYLDGREFAAPVPNRFGHIQRELFG